MTHPHLEGLTESELDDFCWRVFTNTCADDPALRDRIRQALAALAGAGPVACHRLHTSDGKARWMWVDGAPSLQAVDDARNFGWTLELAYLSHAPAKAREVTDADVERAAKVIYDLLPYDGRSETGSKPAWVERGNSLKQGEARQYARAALATFAEGES